ncbi:MAG: hypothetical protein ACFCVD_14380 [Nodosilinea sp.]
MTSPPSAVEASHIQQLLLDYSFDTEAYSVEAVVVGWLQQFEPIWVGHAITEALYQGRYKIVSVDQILQLWQRRGHPIRHFNREFESIILGKPLLCSSAYSEPAESKASQDRRLGPTETDSRSVRESSVAAAASPSSPEQATRASIGQTAPAPARANENPSQRSDRPVPNFRPFTPDLASLWAHAETIQPFVPDLDASGLHQRLKAVVQGGMRG